MKVGRVLFKPKSTSVSRLQKSTKFSMKCFFITVQIQLFYHDNFYFIKLRHKGRVTTTACANDCGRVLPRYIDFREGNRSTRKKTLEAQERSTTGTLVA